MAETDPVASLMSELNSERWNFVAMKAAVEGGDDQQKELRNLMSLFSDLKHKYLELEAREDVLTHVLKTNENVMESLSGQSIEQLERALAEKRKEGSAVRQRISALKNECTRLIAELMAKYRQLELESRALAAAPRSQRPRIDPEAVRAKNEASLAFGKCDPEHLSMSSVAACQAVVDAQVSMIQTLTHETQEMRGAVTDLQMHTGTLQDSVASLRVHARRVTAEAKQVAPEKTVRASQKQWYNSVLRVMGGLSGCDVDGVSEENAVLITLHATVASKMHTMRVSLDASGSKFVRVQIEPAAEIADIAEHALELQDLGFLVREVQARIQRRA